MRNWNRTSLAAGIVLATAGLATAQVAVQPATAPVAARPAVELRPGDLPGPIDNLQDLQDTGKMLFKLADTNNDGLVSQKEAVDAGNLLVGGFFFRADQNGDGTLSPEEAKQAREALFAQQPLLRYVLNKGKAAATASGANANATNPGQAIMSLLDTNNDKQIQATELRQAVQTTVQGVFATADTNRDGQLSPTEINAAMVGMARTAAQAAFQQADADHNGQLSREEFDKAIIEPANMVFAVLDANGDGQITEQEAQQARQIVASQLRNLMMPDAPNSARNLLRTGATPDQVAPIPAVPIPAPRR